MDALSQWKARLAGLFEDLQNYELPDSLLDEVELLVNEAVHLKEELQQAEVKQEAQTKDLAFLRSELAVLQSPGRPVALHITCLPSLSLTAPVPVLATPPKAPVLVLAPQCFTSPKKTALSQKPKYRLLFWTKIDDLPSVSIFSPATRQTSIHFSQEDLAKFAPAPSIAPSSQPRKTAQAVSVLPPRRALVIETALKALGLTPEQIVGKLLTCDMDLCGNCEKLTVLYSALPKEEDLAAVQSLLGVRNVAIGPAESFVLAISSVSGLKSLLDCIIFQATFDLSRSELTTCLENWLRICQVLRSNDDLKSVFLVVLALGNALNEGHSRLSTAKGFKLDILEDLETIRSISDPAVSLLDLVVGQFFALRRERVKFYSKEELGLLREVAAASFAQMHSSATAFLQQFQTVGKVDYSPQFRCHMSAFVAAKTQDVCELEHLLASARQGISEVHSYFGAQEETDSEGCFLLFRQLHRFYSLCETLFQRMTIGKSGAASSKRYTLTPSERLSLRRQSRVH